ncbi:XrtA/PEP-CTERM system histidine kinase PrsK [Glaciecola sp. KUL10]|uniref:XrtA/PEP-CTERM system histidine kinase PrsK n=1 Tax=Glaciecola sp. (strain KUL10) TaxID=2161813 RepID=UPI000D7843ED|nr:XrtA/PEP-CTERM system histidine kinase PrsK [Glaciecola sp. KUL10]GBL05607.1 sensor histidine kinase [Glaciecola sp. KUL10]
MFSDLGYALSAVSYIGLFFLLSVTGVKGGLNKVLLVLVAITGAAWSALHLSLFHGIQNLSAVLFYDSVKLFVFVTFSLSCLKHKNDSALSFLVSPLSLCFLGLATIPFLLLFLMPSFFLWMYVALMIVALSILILMEMLYRQSAEQKWQMKPLVFFFGALALFDFVTYANASMVSQLGISYVQARGYIYLLTLPFLVLAIRRIDTWGVSIYISRDIVLHSSLLMLAGAYLFVMALIGYLVKYLGGEWSYSLQLILIVMSALLLVAVFISEQFRTKLRVFIAKHFYANQFDYRVEWVKLSNLLSDEPLSENYVYDAALSGFIQALGLKSGALYQYKNSVLTPLTTKGMAPLFIDLSAKEQNELLAFITTTRWIVDTQELRYFPARYEGLDTIKQTLKKDANKLFIPLFYQQELWGVVELQTEEAKKPFLNWEVRDYISAVTSQISNYIFHYQNAQALAENAQFAAFSRMSAFVLHDLKNVMAQVDLILTNAQQHKHNPEFIEDTFETLEYTKIRIGKMLSQLTEKKISQGAGMKQVELSKLVREVIDKQCQNLKPIPRLTVLNEVKLTIDSEKMSNVMYHLISNAQQATPNDGDVNVLIKNDEVSSQNQAFAVIQVQDSGEGMSKQFIAERLFKPFDTTKGNTGMGIGAYDARHFVEENQGSISVESEVDNGSQFTIKLPMN